MEIKSIDDLLLRIKGLNKIADDVYLSDDIQEQEPREIYEEILGTTILFYAVFNNEVRIFKVDNFEEIKKTHRTDILHYCLRNFDDSDVVTNKDLFLVGIANEEIPLSKLVFLLKGSDIKTIEENINESQSILQREIQGLGYNVVTCGNCGSTILHKTSDEEITCPDCLFKSEPCDFPDLNC